jgi:NADPH-dependent ferric siderophore reductase
VWCKSLKPGDIIMSRSEAKDNHRHLHTGQAVLIADETAFPAVAGMLERWINPIPPIVILLPVIATEVSYFDDVQFPPNTLVHVLPATPEQQASEALVLLQQLDRIDTAWGACESLAAKRIRHYLRNDRKLSGKLNHIKAYWRLSQTQSD